MNNAYSAFYDEHFMQKLYAAPNIDNDDGNSFFHWYECKKESFYVNGIFHTFQFFLHQTFNRNYMNTLPVSVCLSIVDVWLCVQCTFCVWCFWLKKLICFFPFIWGRIFRFCFETKENPFSNFFHCVSVHSDYPLIIIIEKTKNGKHSV